MLLSLISLASVSCLNDGDKTIVLANQSAQEDGGQDNTGETVPANPYIVDPNTDIPNIQYDVEEENGVKYLILYMTGIQKPNDMGWLRLVGTSGGKQQNIWSSIDDKPKALTVYNAIDGQDQSKTMKNDLVFLIDNSGSMDDEANAIARDIVEWAQTLSQSIDIRFAIVGYDGRITGAINFTTQDNIATYLNRSTGVYRTCGFSGDDAIALETAAGKYGGSSATECPMMALHYANDNLAFREGANRVYVNFTDEPNENYDRDEYSVHYLASQDNWDPADGTIHTVYSSTDNQYNDSGTVERPWMMSEYTGGTVLFTNSSFTGVSLNDLPVTGSMKNTYVVKFGNVMQYMDNKKHTIKLTVMTIDMMVRAEREFEVNFSKL